MHILLINNTVIPAKEYGGVERIIWWLGKELVRLGHRVTYLAAGGSSCPFAQVLTYDPQRELNAQIPENVDFVHSCIQAEGPLKKPYLMMYQYNYHPQETFNINTVFCSRDHAQRNGSEVFVHNAIDPDDYGLVDFNAPRKHLLFLGYAKRPEKNLKDCLYIARKTGNVLAVVGGKDKWFKRRPWVRYEGFLGGEAKNAVLGRAKALLFPVRWYEPFGLAIIEGLYFGCPVIGTPYGSLSELINPEVGLLSDSRSQLVDAVRNLKAFDPRKCHEYVCERFNSRKMAQEYLSMYGRVLAGQSLNPQKPVNGGNFSREILLPIHS
jgi:glycosyltransferase involved in cell wall biosynthesis